MRRFKLTNLFAGLFILAALALPAETIQLNNGRSISGEILVSSANDAGVQVKTGEGVYERVSWSEFSQATLKELAQMPKLATLVEPFIEIPQQERLDEGGELRFLGKFFQRGLGKIRPRNLLIDALAGLDLDTGVIGRGNEDLADDRAPVVKLDRLGPERERRQEEKPGEQADEFETAHAVFPNR